MTATKPLFNPQQYALIYVFFIVLGIYPTVVMAAQVNVTTDRNPVSLNESFRITFSATESPDDDPDFSPLEQDFDLLNQSSSSQTSWVNGKSSKTIQWILTVMAKQVGNIAIPAIRFGDDMSQPSSITVTPNSQQKNADAPTDDLFLTVEASPENPYVQSQVLYTLKLFTRIEIAQARLNEPELADAVIEKLGDDSNYSTQIDGVNYSVTERKYAIFPQKSGSITIKPLVLTAEVLTANPPSFNGFFNQQFTKTRRVESKAITLEVKPAPPEFNDSNWLSADELHLTQEFSGDPLHVNVGEPLTRTLSLLAKGATVGQLPEINNSKSDDQLKSYPDQPVLQEQKKPDGFIALREEKIALIPGKPGDYLLPAIEIPWFDSKSQKIALAKIPATKITAISSVNTSTATPIPTQKQAMPPQGEPAPKQQPEASSHHWLWLALFFGFGWLATLIYFLTRTVKHKPETNPRPDGNKSQSLRACIHSLKQACSDNNASTAKNALLDWGRLQFKVSNLSTLAELCNPQLKEEILLLNRTLYGKADVQWQGKKLFQAFSEENTPSQRTATKAEALEPLYRL
jgi:hypothetical protein